MLHTVLGILALILILGTVAAWPLGWATRRWYGLRLAPEERLPPRARMTLWTAAALFLAFFVGLVIALSDPTVIAVKITAGLRLVLLLPILAALFTAVALFFVFRIFRTGAGRRTTRVLYALTTLSFCVLVWQLHVWNLLGWRF